MSTELVLPVSLLDVRTGEVLPAQPDKAARLLADLRDYRALVQEAIRACEAVIADESARTGTKTLTLGGVDVEVYGGTETEWDIDFLVEALEEEGCPSDRIAALIKTEVIRKVDRRVEKMLASANHRYAQVIEAAKTTRPAATRVRVKAR